VASLGYIERPSIKKKFFLREKLSPVERRKGIIKIRTEANEIEIRKTKDF
jgi:hypothetical protein